jgi:putative membrane protein
MLTTALLSTFHLLALALGLPGVFLRGAALRAVQRQEPSGVARVLRADNAWGVAALLWLATGLTRALGGFEKGWTYYLHSGPFLIKMGCLALVFGLEVLPMITFIRWRIAQARGAPLDLTRVPLLTRLNDVELALTLAMPFLASLMARGVGFGLFDAPA